MAKKKNPIYYKREKNNVEIKGDHPMVRWIIVFDLISYKFLWIILTLLLIFTIPKISWLPALLKWLK